MELTREKGREVVWDDHPDWDMVKGTKQAIDHGRWTVSYKAVFFHKPTKCHYKMTWSVGATESQDEQPFEYYDPEPVLVEEREVTTTEWVAVEPAKGA